MTKMQAGWEETTLGEVCEIQTGKNIPTNEQSNKWVYEIIGANGIIGYTNSFLLNWEYILTWRVGTIGEITYKRGQFYPSDNVIYIKANPDNSNIFLFYLLKTKNLKVLNVGSTQPLIKQSDIKHLPIHLPPLPEQKAIAAVLSSFDDKIELLRAENQTLEQMGQELFKEWFGKWKVGDELPEGWRVGKLRDIAEITSWKRPVKIQEKKNWLFSIPLIWATKIMWYVEDFLFDGETLVIWRVWTHWEVQMFYEKIFPSDNTLVIKSDNFYFTYFILKSIDYQKMNRWAVQPLITQSDLKSYEFMIPDQETLSKFSLVINPIFSKIRANLEQNQTLSATRDQLLPKLMSGEVRVEF